MTRRVTVVGAGVAGLAAAWALRRAGADVLVVEASERTGGLVETERAPGGLLLEHGPDAILGSRPAARRMLDDLGLGGDVMNDGPAPRRAYLATDHAGLVALPEGLGGLVPRAPLALFRSPLFSTWAKLRLALEPLVPADDPPEGTAIAGWLDSRLGSEPRARLFDPMLRAIYGVAGDRLDLDATMPHLRALLREHHSLGIAALRLSRREAPQGLVALRSGMESLVAAMVEDIGRDRIVLGAPVTSLDMRPGRVDVVTARGRLETDAVVLAIPAWQAARLVEPTLPGLAGELGAIEHVSADAVTLAYDRDAVGHALDGTGHVVARSSDATRACTWASGKWAGRAPPGTVLLRSVVDAPEARSDELVSIARAEVEALLDIRAAPILVRVRRHARALPVPSVGHGGRRERIRAHARAQSWIRLAGGASGALGVPECLATGLTAAAELAA